MSDVTRFPSKIAIRVPAGFAAAVEAAARQRFTTPSEWTRQTLLRGLEASGVRVTDTREPEANHGKAHARS